MGSGFKLLLVAVTLAVMSLFFCHPAFGSFQSTHGPTSTIDAGAVSLDLAVMLFVFAIPAVTFRSAVRRLDLESFCESTLTSHPLRTLLCTFRC